METMDAVSSVRIFQSREANDFIVTPTLIFRRVWSVSSVTPATLYVVSVPFDHNSTNQKIDDAPPKPGRLYGHRRRGSIGNHFQQRSLQR